MGEQPSRLLPLFLSCFIPGTSGTRRASGRCPMWTGSVRRWLSVLSLACLLGGGLALRAWATNTGQDASFVPFVSCGARVGFRTLELLQGNADRNGDGDALDLDVQILTLPGGGIVDLGIDGSGALACGGDLFAFGVGEANQNNTDLNGDGDKFDSVLHVYDAGSATLTNTGVPVTAVVASPSLVAFTVSELSANNTDL